MRALRLFPFALALTVAVSIVAAGGPSALSQAVDDAEQAAEEAERRANVAEGLVDTALGQRAEIETELAASISLISDLSAELSMVSSSLDALRAQIGFADAQLSGIKADIEDQAIDAYMTALVTPGVTFFNSATVERAMVAGQVVEDVVTSGKQRVDELVIRRDALEQLQIEYRNQQGKVATLKAEVDAEIEHLAALYDEADAAVGEAIRQANVADAAYREALSAVDAAQAREAEKRRQEERRTSATTPANPGTEPPSNGSTTTTAPAATPSTDSDGGGGGGNWDFPPAIEQWRSIVQQFFPSGRVDEALRIIQCESLGDADAYNPYSGASGLFQFLPSTWATTAPKAGFSGSSVFDPVANIGTAFWLADRYHDLGQSYWQPWSCRRVLS
jgi:septal ring factor EnvC (AmiA/AmiB activator)